MYLLTPSTSTAAPAGTGAAGSAARGSAMSRRESAALFVPEELRDDTTESDPGARSKHRAEESAAIESSGDVVAGLRCELERPEKDHERTEAHSEGDERRDQQ